MTISFHTPGLLSLKSLTVMGLSAKENDNPIGYFGTGLKYALAILMRTGHEIDILIGDDIYSVGTVKDKFRNVNYEQVVLYNNFGEIIELPFTTELGKNWEVWQAYRELHSNTLDEKGEINNRDVSPGANDTVINVRGTGIEQAWHERDTIFLSSQPVYTEWLFEVHAGMSEYLYYNGVRVYKLEKPSRFTYNHTGHCMLTEDRTLAREYIYAYQLAAFLMQISDTFVVHKVLSAGDTFENTLNFGSAHVPSQEFIDAAREVVGQEGTNTTLKPMLESVTVATQSYIRFNLTKQMEDDYEKAIDLLRPIAPELTDYDVRFVETLGPNVLGAYDPIEDTIYIPRQCFSLGVLQIARSLYEEYVHKKYQYQDETRELENFLFDTIIGWMKEIEGGLD